MRFDRTRGFIALVLLAGAVGGCGAADPVGPEPPSGSEFVGAIVLRGEFHDVATSGMGLAEVVQAPDGTRTLRFSDFATVSGPVLEVYMVAADDSNDDETVVNAGFVSLGLLKSVSGNQSYEIPRDLDLDVFRSVTVWCVTFGINFTTAPLKPF